MVFENGVKNTQAAAYNGARKVFSLMSLKSTFEPRFCFAPYLEIHKRSIQPYLY